MAKEYSLLAIEGDVSSALTQASADGWDVNSYIGTQKHPEKPDTTLLVFVVSREKPTIQIVPEVPKVEFDANGIAKPSPGLTLLK